MAYTLEDEFGDIIGKARRGNGLSLGGVAARCRTHGGATVPDGRLHTETDGGPESTKSRRASISTATRLADIAMERWGPEPVPSGYDDASGGCHHYSRCRWMARPCVPT